MKKIVQLTLVAAGLLSGFVAQAADEPTLVPASYHTAYLPFGFDSNDNVQIVAEGLFSNSCYRAAPAEIKVDEAAKVINVFPKAYKYEGMCLQLLVPYSQVLDLGILKAGNYEVRVPESKMILGSLVVKQTSHSEPDDYLYAPVTQAYFQKDNGKNQVVLTGEFSNSCMRLARTLVDVQPKVVIIQPVADIAASGSCVSGSFPFKQVIDLPAMNDGRYLLHVRSLNGHALNTLFDIR